MDGETIVSLPLVSIVIINYNDKGHLKSCINSVLKTDYPSFEVIIVDDGSIDGSIDLVRQEFGGVLNISIISNRKNLGASAARNVGGQRAKGKYIAFLDSDTTVDLLWLKEAVTIMEHDSNIGAAQCKLLLASDKNKFDYAGDYLSPFGILVQRVKAGQVDNGSLDKIEEIFAVKSAGMIIRRDVFFATGMFDNDYFIYVEETDLCWRVWLTGHSVVFAPTSRVYHDFGSTPHGKPNRPKSLEKYHGPKNYLTTIIKNFGLLELFRVLPLNLGVWIGLSTWYIFKFKLDWSRSITKGVLYNLVNFKQIWAKRQFVQYCVRKVPDNVILPKIMKKTPFSYLVSKVLYSGGWSS